MSVIENDPPPERIVITAPGPRGPQGVKGDTGDAGPAGPEGADGLVWRGNWDIATAYDTDEAVFYLGSSYRATQGTTGDIPDANPSIWAPIALQGNQGPAGMDGSPGQPGDPGQKGDQGDPGQQGPPGNDGTGVVWRGDWDSATAYAVDDAVSNQGSSYVALNPSTNSEPVGFPLSANADWKVMASRGADGPAGNDGMQGQPGNDGAPGVVQSIQPGTNVSVDSSDPANPIVSSAGGGGGGTAPYVRRYGQALLAVGAGGIARSYDGKDWEVVNDASIGPWTEIHDVFWTGREWIIVGLTNNLGHTEALAFSATGEVWYPVPAATPLDGSSDGGRAISYNGKRYLMVGKSASTGQIIAWSIDARTWNALTTSWDGTGANDVDFNEAGWLVAISQFSGPCVLWADSGDEIDWVGRSTPHDNQHALCVEWAQKKWVVGGDGWIMSSAAVHADGGWTSHICPLNIAVNDVDYNGKLWVAVGSAFPSDPDPGVFVMTSPDGATWTPQVTANDATLLELRSVVWNGELWVAVGVLNDGFNTGQTLWSEDGITWTSGGAASVGGVMPFKLGLAEGPLGFDIPMGPQELQGRGVAHLDVAQGAGGTESLSGWTLDAAFPGLVVDGDGNLQLDVGDWMVNVRFDFTVPGNGIVSVMSDGSQVAQTLDINHFDALDTSAALHLNVTDLVSVTTAASVLLVYLMTTVAATGTFYVYFKRMA